MPNHLNPRPACWLACCSSAPSLLEGYRLLQHDLLLGKQHALRPRP